MKPSKWPYRPDHITNDGEKYEGEDLSRLDGVGIISNEYIKGLQTSISGDLGYPTLIVEFSPDPKGKPVRTDSKLIVPYGKRPACKELQICTEIKLCNECDNIHALLFRGLNRSNLRTEVAKQLEENAYLKELREDAYIKDYLADPEQECKLKTISGRDYLEYDCWLLGLRELIFPVFFERKVIAVFVTGQIYLDWKLEFIKRRHENFLSGNANCFFNKYLDANKCLVSDKRQTIIKMFNKWYDDEKEELRNEEQYEKLISNCGDKIEDLERTLVIQMSLQRNRYVRTRAERRIEKFRNNLPDKKCSSKEKWDLLWKNTEERLDELCSDFTIKYIIVFASKIFDKKKSPILDVVVEAGNVPEELQECISSGRLKFNVEKIPEDIGNRLITSMVEKRVLDGLEGFPGKINRKRNVIRTFSISLFPKALLVILVEYYDCNPPGTEENRWSNQSSSAPPNTFYTVVLSAFSSILADIAETKLNRSLQVLGHEADNLNFGLDRIRKRYLDDVRRLKALSEERARDVSRDIKGYFAQLNYLFKQAKMAIDKLPQPNKKLFWVYKTSLFKWRDIYRLKSFDKKISFEIYEPNRNDIKYPKVYADPVLLELVIYNFVSNAVKYCYDGTKIEIECKRTKPRDKRSPHIVRVIDYGKEIKCDNLFDFGSRGDNVEGIVGVGIGMFNAQRIANAHGSEIEKECTKLSDFNIPVIEPYINSDFKGKDKGLVERLKSELNTLKKSGEYEKIIALSRWGLRLYNPEGYELSKFIQEPIYKVTFKMKIFAKER